MIWSLLPHPSPDHVVRTFWRKPDGTRGGDYARSEGELNRFIKATVGRNAYIAPNPTKSTIGDRHSAGDVTHWSYFLVDIDPVEDDFNPQLAQAEVMNLMHHWLGILGTSVPTVIDSGRGIQLWYRLDDLHLYEKVTGLPGEGLTPRDGISWVCERGHARKAMGCWLRRLEESIGLLGGCKIDTSTSDLPRLMRLPGTVNLKTGRAASIIHPGTGPIQGLAQRMVAETPAGVFVERTYEGCEGRSWQDAYGELTQRAQRYLSQGWTEPGRHVAMWHAAKTLSERGVSKDQAREAILYGNGLQGPDEELSGEDIESALKTAYGA